MPSATSPPRSILKPPSTISKDSPAPSTLSQEDRNRQLALQHAYVIQYRKDIETLIQTSLETLLDLPTSPTTSPSEPSPTDQTTVKEALKPFQPSDYDALIEERNINHRCGYVFCRRENRKQNKGSKYRIVTGRNFKVIGSKELEKWCSDECGMMALFLRVQLSEEPAWTREWEGGEPLELYGESGRGFVVHNSKDSVPQHSIPPEVLEAKQTLAIRMKDLAVERGDKDDTAKASARVAINVKENVRREQKMPVPPNEENTHADMIEGYTPIGRDISKQTPGRDDDEEDLMPTI
ncbi:MAG: hypothetical protein Q9213_006095 [Squamulea squamosa]